MNKGNIWHNGNVGLALVTRSGTQVLFKEVVNKYHTGLVSTFINSDVEWKPTEAIESVKDLNTYDVSSASYAVIVRDPVERFRSSCVRLGYTVEQGLSDLENIHLISLKNMGLLESPNVRYFPYSNEGLANCLNYLGLSNTVSLPEEDESKKPVLTSEQVELIRSAYSYDCEVFNNL
jgi:hypothetical protein